MPKHEEPSWSVQFITDQTSWRVRPRKRQRLQQRKRAAEHVTACEREKGAQRLYRELSKQKGCRDKIDNAQDSLQNRNEGINASHLYARERCDNSRRDGQKDNDADRYRLLSSGCRHRCDN